MSIKEDIFFDGKKFHGYVDLGCNVENNAEIGTKAKNAFVLMAVSINKVWKVPLGYFLIKSLNGKERANIIYLCLTMLAPTGAKVKSITFDGAPSNISMCVELGCNFNYGTIYFKPWFLNPITKEKVSTF